MDDLSKILLEVYRPNFEYTFRDHPDKDKIVEVLETGNFESKEQVDIWFAEAANYSWKKIVEAAKNMKPNKDGTVTFNLRAKEL